MRRLLYNLFISLADRFKPPKIETHEERELRLCQLRQIEMDKHVRPITVHKDPKSW